MGLLVFEDERGDILGDALRKLGLDRDEIRDVDKRLRKLLKRVDSGEIQMF
jgi:hypothetical protein